MIRKLAQFEVRHEAVPQALAAVRAYADEVARKEGGTASYRAFQHADDPARFTLMMEFRTPSAEQYHHKTAWAKVFLGALLPLCVREPAYTELVAVAE